MIKIDLKVNTFEDFFNVIQKLTEMDVNFNVEYKESYIQPKTTIQKIELLSSKIIADLYNKFKQDKFLPISVHSYIKQLKKNKITYLQEKSIERRLKELYLKGYIEIKKIKCKTGGYKNYITKLIKYNI
jgi:hypothetical protein